MCPRTPGLGTNAPSCPAAQALSVHAVRKRWNSIYAKVEDGSPELLRAEAGDSGTQKQCLLLAYLRSCPEVLRPYAPSKAPRSLAPLVRACIAGRPGADAEKARRSSERRASSVVLLAQGRGQAAALYSRPPFCVRTERTWSGVMLLPAVSTATKVPPCSTAPP